MLADNSNQKQPEDESSQPEEKSTVSLDEEVEKSTNSTYKLNSESHSMWDAFEHVLLFTSLYVSPSCFCNNQFLLLKN